VQCLLECLSLCRRISGYIVIDISGHAWPTVADVQEVTQWMAAVELSFDLSEDEARACPARAVLGFDRSSRCSRTARNWPRSRSSPPPRCWSPTVGTARTGGTTWIKSRVRLRRCPTFGGRGPDTAPALAKKTRAQQVSCSEVKIKTIIPNGGGDSRCPWRLLLIANLSILAGRPARPGAVGDRGVLLART
jgi:hypothetical protein